MHLIPLRQKFAVCKLGAAAELPEWVQGGWFSVTRTPDELSIVCEEQRVPHEVEQQRGWSGLMVQGPLPFTALGILAELSAVLAAAQVSIFVVSTFNTDYLFFPQEAADSAYCALRNAGHEVA